MSFSLQLSKPINSPTIGFAKELSMPLGKNDSEIDIKIHYTDEGSGEPLILVHSFGQSLYTWHGIVEGLSSKYRVIAIDLIGHGYSSAPQYCSYSIDNQADMIIQLMKKLNIGSAHFVGFSQGCAVIARLAAEHPTKVSRIIMLSPGGITPMMPTLLKAFESAFFGALASVFVNQTTIASMLQECFLDLTLVNDQMIEQYSKTLEIPENKRAARLFASSFDEKQFTEDLMTISSPVLILMSSDDKWRSIEQVQEYFNLIKNASSSQIRNAGHLMHEEQPSKIIASVLSFIDADNSIDDDKNQDSTNEQQ